MSNTLFQNLFDIFESLRMQQQQQQRQKSRDGSADSLTTRQRVTGAQIPDVWKIMVQGAAGIAQQSIKQHARGGGQTALWFHFFFTWFEVDADENKWSELLT